MKNKQLYIAYGSNINLQQMAYRCPHSRVAGTSEIKDFELEFRGVATIVPKKGASVPVLIWELDDRDLPALIAMRVIRDFTGKKKCLLSWTAKKLRVWRI